MSRLPNCTFRASNLFTVLSLETALPMLIKYKFGLAGGGFQLNLELVEQFSTNSFSPFFRYFNRVQEKRGVVYDKVTAIQKEIQQMRFKIQQLNESAEEEEMKAKVSCVGLIYLLIF